MRQRNWQILSLASGTRSLALVAPTGALLALVTLFAHPLGLRSRSGWGWKETTALVVALGLIALGAVLRRKAPDALALYVGVSIAVFGLAVRENAATNELGSPLSADPSTYIWMLVWWPHAILHGLNPFLPDVLFAPDGFNLAWAASIPGPSLILAPVTAVLGPVASYNLLMLLAPALSAWAAFLLCHHITSRYGPSFVGGYIFGFSSYEVTQTAAHANLTLLVALPLCALVILRYVEGTLPPVRLVGAMTLLLVLQFLTSTEVFASLSVFLACAFVIGLVTHWPRRRQLAMTAKLVAISYGLTAVVVSPVLYYALGEPGVRPINSPETYSADIANLFFPTPATWLGHDAFSSLSAHYSGNLFENGAYFGLPLLLIVVSFMRRGARGGDRFLTLFALAATVAALGPRLHVAGFTTIAMPWLPFTHMPLLRHALPVRFIAYASLALAAMTALQLARWPKLRATALAVAAVVFLLPNFGSWVGHTRASVPPFFGKSKFTQTDRLLLIPYGNPGPSMLYHAEAHMGFGLAGGYVGVPPESYSPETFPVIGNLQSKVLGPNDPAAVRQLVQAKGITAVVVDPRDNGPWRQQLSGLGVKPRADRGVVIYSVREARASSRRDESGR